jgi:hypothetical protein
MFGGSSTPQANSSARKNNPAGGNLDQNQGGDPRLRPPSMAMQDNNQKSSIEKEIEDLKRKQNDQNSFKHPTH